MICKSPGQTMTARRRHVAPVFPTPSCFPTTCGPPTERRRVYSGGPLDAVTLAATDPMSPRWSYPLSIPTLSTQFCFICRAQSLREHVGYHLHAFTASSDRKVVCQSSNFENKSWRPDRLKVMAMIFLSNHVPGRVEEWSG